jgi:uncharacterized protein (DUF169 family)
LSEVAAEVADGLAVGLVEVGDGFKFGSQALEETDDFEVAVGFAFEWRLERIVKR